MSIVFEVPGEPRGKGRPRFTRQGKTYTDEKTKAYEELIAWQYIQAAKGYSIPDKKPVSVTVRAFYKIPKQVSKETRRGMQLGSILPTKKPDLDNIMKAVLDALNGVAYQDDSCVVAQTAVKFYSDLPHVEIKVEEVMNWNGHK